MAGQPQGLNGINPLSYMGVNPGTPPNLKTYNRAPTVNDSNNFLIGSIWLFPQATTPATSLVWMLTALVGGQATWQMITFDGADEFVTNAGTAFPLAGVLNVLGTGGITTDGAGNTVTISTDGTIATSYIEDVGTAVPIGGVLEVLGGPNINTVGVLNTISVNLNTSISQPATTADSLDGMYSLGGNRFLYSYGPTNTFCGPLSGNLTLTTADAVNDTGIGGGALLSLTTGANNVGIGSLSGGEITSGNSNVSVGSNSLPSVTTGSDNIAIGDGSGSVYTTTESSNIVIGNVGSVLENNTIRIGTQGVGAGQQNATQIAGVYAAPVGTTNQVALVDSTGFLGSSRGDDGQILIGQTGGTGSPAWANITSSDASVGIANGANSIDLTVSGGGGISANPFFGYFSTVVSNVTGNGVTYTMGAWTTLYDFSGGLSVDRFTAPVTGYYQFFCDANVIQTTNNHTACSLSFFVNGGTPQQQGYSINPTNAAQTVAGNSVVLNAQCQQFLNATDFIQMHLVFQAGAQDVSVVGSASPTFSTTFTGYRIA
jgi:hypothetical protein